MDRLIEREIEIEKKELARVKRERTRSKDQK